MLSCLGLLVQSRQKTCSCFCCPWKQRKAVGMEPEILLGPSAQLCCTHRAQEFLAGVLRGGTVVLAAGIKYSWFTQGLQLVWYYCMCFLRYLLQASWVCSWSQCLTAFIASTLQQNTECLNIFIFVPSAPCLRPLCLSISIPCVCVEIIIWEHAVQIKEKSCPVATVKVLKCYLAADASCKVGCDSAGMMPVEMLETTRIKIWCDPHRTRVGVTTQALAYLLCLDPVIWISELFQKSYYTVFCLPAVPGWCNLNFRSVSQDFFSTKLCWTFVLRAAVPFLGAGQQSSLSPPPIDWLNPTFH